MSKKEIAAMAGINPRTINNNRKDWGWLDKCKAKGTRRETFNRKRVEQGLAEMGLV